MVLEEVCVPLRSHQVCFVLIYDIFTLNRSPLGELDFRLMKAESMKLRKPILLFLSVPLLITIISEGFLNDIQGVQLSFCDDLWQWPGCPAHVPEPSHGSVSHVALEHELQSSNIKPALN